MTPPTAELQPRPTVDTTNAMESLAELMGPTPVEREAAERKMQKSKAQMAAWTGLFDGLRQLGNLYYANKGATPQKLDSPYPMVEQNYQQQRQLWNDMANYRRQYAQGQYSLRRQMEQDQQAREKHQATLDWYRNRDEMNAEKVAIQRLKAENDAAYKEATIDEKKRMNDIMADVYAGRISLMEAQEQLAKVRAAHVGESGGRGGGNTGTYGYKTTTYYDDQGRKVTERVPTTGTSPRNPVTPGTTVTQPKKKAAAPRAQQKRNQANTKPSNKSGFFN